MDDLVAAGGHPAQPTLEERAAELRRAAAEAERAMRDYGIDPARPEGRMFSTFIAAVSTFGGIVEAAAEAGRRAAEDERARVSELARAMEIGVKQARIATLNLQVEKENALARIMGETLPLFAKNLREVLVIREEGWRDELKRRWVAGAVAVVLAALGAGYGLRAWQDWEATSGLRACLAQPYVAGGRVWCELTGRAGAEALASAQQKPAGR